MKENNVLIPEIYASYPYDGKILEYYQGVFESVYIVLHPFSLYTTKIDNSLK